MLQIQVLGRGLIPRGYGLAPRKTPINADLNLINLIMATPGLKMKYIDPNNGTAHDLTNKNLKTVWEKFGTDVQKKTVPAKKMVINGHRTTVAKKATVTKPVAPTPAAATTPTRPVSAVDTTKTVAQATEVGKGTNTNEVKPSVQHYPYQTKVEPAQVNASVVPPVIVQTNGTNDAPENKEDGKTEEQKDAEIPQTVEDKDTNKGSKTPNTTFKPIVRDESSHKGKKDKK